MAKHPAEGPAHRIPTSNPYRAARQSTEDTLPVLSLETQNPKSWTSVSGWPCPGWGWSRRRPEGCRPQPGCERRGQEVSHHIQRDKTSSIRWRTPQTPTTAPSQGYRTWSDTRVLILHQLIILPSKRGRDLGLHGFCGSYKPLVSEAESTPKTQQFREE